VDRGSCIEVLNNPRCPETLCLRLHTENLAATDEVGDQVRVEDSVVLPKRITIRIKHRDSRRQTLLPGWQDGNVPGSFSEHSKYNADFIDDNVADTKLANLGRGQPGAGTRRQKHLSIRPSRRS
jgi:hypothetical protein